ESKAIIETSLGRPFEAVGLTQEEYLNKRLLSNQKFMESDYLATYAYDADLTETERFEIAKLNKARTEQAKIAIERRGLISQNNWDTQGRAAYDQIFVSQVNPILGKLQLAAKQGINVDPQSVVQAQLQFQSTVSALPRPQNITDDQWESWTSKVKGVNDLFEAMINRGAKIKAATASSFLQSVSSDPGLTEQAKFLITNAPDELLVSAGRQIDVVPQLKAMSPTPYVDINTIGNPVQFPQATPQLQQLEEGVKGSDAKELLSTAVSLGGTLNMLSDMASPEQVKGFVNETYRSAVALQKMSFDFDDYASGGDIRKIYDGTLLGGIQQVAKVNPDAAQTLLNKHIEALDTQYATGQSKLNRMYQGLFSMDENGMVTVNPERWESRYGGREGFVGAVPGELTKALEEYNGDVAALIRDKGARYQGGLNPSIKFFVQSSDAKTIMSEGSSFAQHLDSLKSINAVRTRFTQVRQGMQPSMEDPARSTQFDTPTIERNQAGILDNVEFSVETVPLESLTGKDDIIGWISSALNYLNPISPAAAADFSQAYELADFLEKEAYSGDPAAAAAVALGEGGGKWDSEEVLRYGGTSNSRIRKIFVSSSKGKSDQELNAIKKDPVKFAEFVYGSGSKQGKVLGNTQPGDGWKFRGRGYFNLTGRDNYKRMGDRIGVDLVSNPDLIIEDKDVSLKVAKAYLEEKNSPADIESTLKAIGGDRNQWDKKRDYYKSLTQQPPIPQPRPSQDGSVNQYLESPSNFPRESQVNASNIPIPPARPSQDKITIGLGAEPERQKQRNLEALREEAKSYLAEAERTNDLAKWKEAATKQRELIENLLGQ
ncbi:MAG: hypothetical protein P1U85_23525, partial [Verrucomicrobiales bacterium]|nr:hypothetical protein [Verrucomicrobiales bacterium]